MNRFGRSVKGQHSMNNRAAHRTREGGQILVVAALAMVAIVAGAALVLEGGNAAAQQRVAQNGADAAANAGAGVLAEQLAGNFRTDAQVRNKVVTIAAANELGSPTGFYTDIAGDLLTPAGVVTNNAANAAVVGGGAIPPGAQGVRIGGTRSFATTLGQVLGVQSMNASADATAVAGRLTGGRFLPIVFPVNIVDCEDNGDLGTGEAGWTLSQPGEPPIGQEFIVPLCKTGDSSNNFMVLDYDGNPNNCAEEALSDNIIRWDNFPVYVESDGGNNCAKPLADVINDNFAGQVVLIPICDAVCSSGVGSDSEYHITKVAAFYLDYMVDSNNPNESACAGNGTTLIPIAGNGSSSCLAGWFIRYITIGAVGAGPIGNTDALGVQLIK
jgi:hypothetical protein